MILPVQSHLLNHLQRTASVISPIVLGVVILSDLVCCLSIPQNRLILKRGLEFSAKDSWNEKNPTGEPDAPMESDHNKRVLEFRLVPGDPIYEHRGNLKAAASTSSLAIRCNSSDPRPDPQPAPPYMGKFDSKFGCPWTWACYKDESRFPPTWLEAILYEPDKAFCQCSSQSDKKGTCRLLYTQTATLLKAHKDQMTGSQLWRVASVPFAAGAYCHISDGHDQQAK